MENRKVLTKDLKECADLGYPYFRTMKAIFRFEAAWNLMVYDYEEGEECGMPWKFSLGVEGHGVFPLLLKHSFCLPISGKTRLELKDFNEIQGLYPIHVVEPTLDNFANPNTYKIFDDRVFPRGLPYRSHDEQHRINQLLVLEMLYSDLLPSGGDAERGALAQSLFAQGSLVHEKVRAVQDPVVKQMMELLLFEMNHEDGRLNLLSQHVLPSLPFDVRLCLVQLREEEFLESFFWEVCNGVFGAAYSRLFVGAVFEEAAAKKKKVKRGYSFSSEKELFLKAAKELEKILMDVGEEVFGAKAFKDGFCESKVREFCCRAGFHNPIVEQSRAGNYVSGHIVREQNAKKNLGSRFGRVPTLEQFYQYIFIKVNPDGRPHPCQLFDF